jgi:1-aminocyclopropane-1-carboxylate deaminase
MSNLNSTELTKWIEEQVDLSYPLHSRIHSLNHFPNNMEWFVKRDDELSFGISGSKYRKYASLLPYLKRHQYKEVHLVGSSHSNHLVGILQLLNENQLMPVVYLLKSYDREPSGNLAFIELLLGKNSLHLLSREEWPQRELFVKKNLSSSSIYIPEGAEMFASLPGALSLVKDIATHNRSFDHLFIDAGTGLSAIALLLGMDTYALTGKAHIILMANTPSTFEKKLFYYKALLEKELSRSISLPRYHLHHSSIGKSFGSTSKAIFEEIRSVAQQEGILTDPVYSAKLFYSAKEICKNHSLKGKALCIHSGGAFTLCGFQKQLFSL